MTGKFLLSLDCEGRWGVADNLHGRNNKINARSLDRAYGFIFDLLDKYEIRATFAFTSLFTVDEEVLQSYAGKLSQMSAMGFDWYAPISSMLKNMEYDGWIGEGYFYHALRSGHEIGWHGFSHHTLENSVHPAVIDFEISNGITVAGLHGIKMDGLIFPRNRVGNIQKLKNAGFTSYRMARQQIDPMSGIPWYRLLHEFNVVAKSQVVQEKGADDLVAIPPGDFLNWPSGARSLVPDAITIARWNSILNDAASTGGVSHLWLHPHNLITAPRMMDLLEAVVKQASRMIREKRLQNLSFNDIF